MRALPIAALALCAALAPSSARADDSTQGPLYVQGDVGLRYWDFPHLQFGFLVTGYSWTGFRPDIEVGYHFSGRHDGFVLGVRQAFVVTAFNFGTGYAAGLTSLRAGCDFAFKASSLEINVDPFGTVGVGYVFDGPHAGIDGSAGIDVKVFLTKGLFAFARPAELGFACLHDYGDCAFTYAAAVGAGYAFGGP
jgi:hypothetical protein